MLGKNVYTLEYDKAVEYKILRVNVRSFFVRSTDGVREFTVRKEEFAEEWFFTKKEAYRHGIEEIDKEIKELRAPIQDRINELQAVKRKYSMRLGTSS